MFGAEKKPEKPQKPARPPSPPAVAETAANMLEDFVAEGKTVRFRSMVSLLSYALLVSDDDQESNKFLRIFPNGHIDAFGGNGPLPYFKLSGTDRYHVRLLNVHSEPLGLSFPVGNKEYIVQFPLNV